MHDLEHDAVRQPRGAAAGGGCPVRRARHRQPVLHARMVPLHHRHGAAGNGPPLPCPVPAGRPTPRPVPAGTPRRRHAAKPHHPLHLPVPAVDRARRDRRHDFPHRPQLRRHRPLPRLHPDRGAGPCLARPAAPAAWPARRRPAAVALRSFRQLARTCRRGFLGSLSAQPGRRAARNRAAQARQDPARHQHPVRRNKRRPRPGSGHRRVRGRLRQKLEGTRTLSRLQRRLHARGRGHGHPAPRCAAPGPTTDRRAILGRHRQRSDRQNRLGAETGARRGVQAALPRHRAHRPDDPFPPGDRRRHRTRFRPRRRFLQAPMGRPAPPTDRPAYRQPAAPRRTAPDRHPPGRTRPPETTRRL